ncbi:MAG TPA: amidohydrolase family protein, partial [Acidimicrobiales bacterium]
EAGGSWIPGFVEHLADVHKKAPQSFDGDPVEQFKRQMYVSPFHEDDLAEVIDVIGADHVLFGSDYPHPEGLAEPCSYVDHLPPGLPEQDLQKIMGGNLARIMKVDAPVGVGS